MKIGGVNKIGKRLALTSLIDVIFLLLLFFMLTSTFSQFGDIEFSSGGSGIVTEPNSPPLYVKLSEERLSLNGELYSNEELISELIGRRVETDTNVILSVSEGVTAQRLINIISSIRTLDGFALQIVR